MTIIKVHRSRRTRKNTTSAKTFDYTTASDCQLLAKTFGVSESSAEKAIYNAGSINELVKTGNPLSKRLTMAMELMERIAREELSEKPIINAEEDIIPLVQAMRYLENEEFRVLYLNQYHRVIADCVEFTGTIDGAAVYPREIVKSCINFNAAAVVFVHNHPSGNSDPSMSDERITKRLIEALRLIEVRVLDHIIVGDTCTSMVNRGLM